MHIFLQLLGHRIPQLLSSEVNNRERIHICSPFQYLFINTYLQSQPDILKSQSYKTSIRECIELSQSPNGQYLEQTIWNRGEKEILDSVTNKSIFISKWLLKSTSFWLAQTWFLELGVEFLGFERDAYLFSIAQNSLAWILIIYGFANCISWLG